MSGRVCRAEAFDWPRFSSGEHAGQWHNWQSYILGTSRVRGSSILSDSVLTHFKLREDHLGKIINTARGLLFQGAERNISRYERRSCSV
jgi:hypothetical protein